MLFLHPTEVPRKEVYPFSGKVWSRYLQFVERCETPPADRGRFPTAWCEAPLVTASSGHMAVPFDPLRGLLLEACVVEFWILVS